MGTGHARRWLFALVAIAACGVAAATAGASGKTAVIKSAGSDHFAPNPAAPPNKEDIVTLHWAPGIITVHSGGKLMLVHGDNVSDPHVLFIAKPKHLPTSSSFNPFKVPAFAAAVVKLLVNPAFPPAGFKAYQANAGRNGLNQEGDALVILPGGPHKTATWFVSAKAGTVLHYFCVIHPWMQGEIKVIK